MASPIRFGTDGLRGAAGEPPLDSHTLRRVGAALGAQLSANADNTVQVLFGHDGRASSPWILQALVDGLASAGVSAVDAGLLTTPALAHVTRLHGFDAGVMISASHNPACDNGIKIFATDGSKLADPLERQLEQRMANIGEVGATTTAIADQHDRVDAYRTFLCDTFADLDLKGQVIALDAAHGGGAVIAPAILSQLGAEVITIGCSPDGHNINDAVGALHPTAVREVVLARHARLGICLDGDGDRVILVDDSGEIRDGDEVMAALAPTMRAAGDLTGDAIVATVMSNLGLRKALERHQIGLQVTPVGDRAVVQAMRDGGYQLGGEQSGHIIFGGAGHYTGDGLFAALRLLALPAALSNTAALFRGFRRYPQVLLNLPVADKPDLSTLPEVMAAVRAVEDRLADDGRVLLRYSGTENLCRVMVEGPEPEIVQRSARAIADAVVRCIS